jgi:hypothetical protein
MSSTFECGDNSALVAYLYDECEPEERGAIATHVAVCGACAAELAALESTRVQLTAWTPPEADLGFVVTRQPEVPAPGRASWFARPLPAWAQAAAAVVIFGAGLSLGVVRGATESAPAADVAAAVPGGAAAVSASDLAALEQRLRREIAQTRTSAAPAPLSATPSVADAPALGAVEGQLLARVRALIEESEQRQQRELALRTADIMRDFDSQRSVDLEQIQRSFGQMEGVTSAEVREQRQLLNYLMRVSQGQ